MPIMQLLLLPWAATFEQKNILLSVIDNDRSAYSQQLVKKVSSSGYFKLTNYADSYAQALNSMDRNTSDLILEIPHGFERDMFSEQRTNLMLTVNAVNGQKAGLGASYMGQIIAEFNRELWFSELPQLNMVNMVNIQPYYKYNPDMNYHNFMVPAVLVMLITLIGGMLASLNIVKEKEIGTIEQINVTPIPKATFILGKLIPFWIIGFVILTVGFVIAWLIYGLLPVGSLSTIYTFAFFYLLVFSGAGLLISNYSNTQQQAMFITFFFMIIFFLLGGIFTPISSMPKWAQTVTLLNPVRYFAEVMRAIYLKGSSISELTNQLFTLIGFTIAFNFWAVTSYRKKS